MTPETRADDRALAEVLSSFFSSPPDSPADLHDAVADFAVHPTRRALNPWPGFNREWARHTGQWLVRHGTNDPAVWLGLGLLGKSGTAEDADLIRTTACRQRLTRPAIEALSAIGDTDQDLLWLADRIDLTDRPRLNALLRAMCAQPTLAVREWLLRNETVDLYRYHARELADALDLPTALAAVHPDEREVGLAAWILPYLVGDHEPYPATISCYEMTSVHLGGIPPTLARYAAAASLVEELVSGNSVHLNWAGGQRERIMARLRRVLASAPWRETLRQAENSSDEAVRWRADWASHLPEPTGGEIEIRVVVSDPLGGYGVQTRLLVDGRPVVTRVFPNSRGEDPDRLIGRLSPRDPPGEVRLAEAECVEACCGAVYVTPVRDGDFVVWRDWRCPNDSDRPEYRFSAVAYEAEIARAERERGWEWPGRVVARLVRSAVEADPTLLGRWGYAFDFVESLSCERDKVRFVFRRSTHEQSLWLIDVLDIPLEEQVAGFLSALRCVDPRTLA